MFISGFHIDGFGIYHNQGVQDLPLGLVVFVGDNESGKTTLMEFIRTMLFGLKPKGRNHYPPLRGGGHGGRLALVMMDGRRILVERAGKQATITVNGQGPVRGEPGEILLKGMNRTTFEHIFAVGLEELQGLKVLDQEDIRGRLLSPTPGLRPASVPTALKRIDDELGTLWAPRSPRRLNQLLHRLQEVTREIKSLQGQAAAYAATRQRLEELESQSLTERAEMERLRQRLRRLEQLQQGREPWALQLVAQKRAEALEALKDFPPHGLERLAQLKRELEEIRQTLAGLEMEAADFETRLGQVAPDEALLHHQEQIDALSGEREKIAACLTELPSLRQSLRNAEEEYRRRLADLGPDWDEDRLTQVDTSVAVRLQVQEFGRKLEAAARGLEQRQSQEEFLERQLAEARRQAQETRKRLEALPEAPIKTLDELRHRQEILWRLRDLFHQRQRLEDQLDDRRQSREEAEARLTSFQNELLTHYDPVPWWALGSLAFGGFLLDVALSVYGYHLAGNLVLLGALLLTGLLFLWRRRLLSREDARRLRFLAEAETVGNRVRALAEEIHGLESQVTALTQEIARQSREVGPEPLQEPAPLDRLIRELEQARDQLQARLTLEAEVAKIEKLLDESREQREQARRETSQAASGLQALTAEWQQWLKSRGLPGSVQPAAFEALLQAVERAREAGTRLKELRRRLRETEDYLAAARERLHQVLAACGRAAKDGLPGVEDLDRLRRALAEALAQEKEKRELEHGLNAARKQATLWRSQLQEKEAELQRLLSQAGALDEDDFRRRAALYQEYLDLKKRLEQSDIALLHIAGHPEALKELREELSRTDPLVLEGEKQELEERLRALAESVSQTDQEVGGLRIRLSEMAQDEKLGNLLQEQSLLKEQLKEALKRWAVLVISRHLLEVARDLYERERQPQVIREAGRFLELMLGERRRLVAVPGEPGLQLEDSTLRRKDEPRWSAGLADQVYLSVRLGLAREFSRRAEPLPVILDEVLAKFDSGRRRGAARVILEFARDQQVLLFTCHPEFQEIIADLQQEEPFRETPVSFFRITDGIIRPVPHQPLV